MNIILATIFSILAMWKIADIAFWLGYNSHYLSDYFHDYKEFREWRKTNLTNK